MDWNDLFKGRPELDERVFNYCRILAGQTADSDSKIAIAAVFHDLGIWSDKTFDYLEPSVALARRYLKERPRCSWESEVSHMIRYHHKLRPYRAKDGRLVEAFRRADLVDLTKGRFKFGLDPTFIREVSTEFPYAGFHRRVLELALKWALRHPLNPLPMIKR